MLEGAKDEKDLMIGPEGVHAVEQFALAKYYMTTNVYRHRVRLITDQMIVRAITLGIEEYELKNLRRLYSFDNSSSFFGNYTQWNDARFMLTFEGGNRSNRLCGQMLQRLLSRQLLKQIFLE